MKKKKIETERERERDKNNLLSVDKPQPRLCFDVNSNSYSQNNQVLTQTNQTNQTISKRERERDTTYL